MACEPCLFDCGPQSPLEVDPPLTDAAPADTVQVGAVNQATQQRDPLRPVLVDVIQRRAGIEARAPAKVDASAKPAHGLHRRSGDRERLAAGPAKTIILSLGVARLVGSKQ